jgi:hypothetical protein
MNDDSGRYSDYMTKVPMKPRLPNESLDDWIVRSHGAFPDTEFDSRNDFRFLSLPKTQKENAEGFGVFDDGQHKI